MKEVSSEASPGFGIAWREQDDVREVLEGSLEVPLFLPEPSPVLEEHGPGSEAAQGLVEDRRGAERLRGAHEGHGEVVVQFHARAGRGHGSFEERHGRFGLAQLEVGPGSRVEGGRETRVQQERAVEEHGGFTRPSLLQEATAPTPERRRVHAGRGADLLGHDQFRRPRASRASMTCMADSSTVPSTRTRISGSIGAS